MDRASIQADPEITKLIRERFVLVAGDRWYLRRRKDVEGRFVMELDKQAQILRAGKSVQQGLYCFTAAGKLLYHRNNRLVALQALKKALDEWESLPPESRKPGAIKVEEKGKPDAKYVRKPPEDGLIVNVFMRILDRKEGELRIGTSAMPGGAYSSRDRLWITQREWRSLIPSNPRKGEEVNVPPGLRQRIIRYHLVDHTRGQAYPWSPRHVQKSSVKLTVAESSDLRVKLQLTGSALLASAADLKEAKKGFDVSFLGYVEIDRAKRKVTRFDFVALGEHWGEGRYNRGARPGRTPFGVAFELCPSDDPGRQVPPLGTTDQSGYFGRP